MLSPGDEITETAAVRDLHLNHPYQYQTDVETRSPELWENNPYLTKLDATDSDVELIEMEYPLIHQSNEKPYHFIHGYMQFLAEYLGIEIKPTVFKGDIHISDLEKSWTGQVHEIAGSDIPFWIIDAGGKMDFTIKWWDVRRYQEVVDHFRGRILFVQVGLIDPNHYHPKLDGVIDLRGKTDMRQLIRLMYHAQGVLCPVTSMMHLAAAVETKDGVPEHRPCVVVAGGREPMQWEAYPHHQYIHLCGALECCSQGGCWRSRTVPIGDGDEKDNADKRCVDVVRGLPRCMDMIHPDEVIRRIESYFDGGTVKYLSPEVSVPDNILTAPELNFQLPNKPGAVKSISRVDIHTADGIITYYPNKANADAQKLRHAFFAPNTLTQAIETVVGDCNGFTAAERWEHEAPMFAEYILKSLEEDQNVILDYGCGVGRIAKEILRQNRDVRVIGVDVSENELSLAREYVDDERFSTMLPHELDRTVDLAYCIYVLQHVSAIEIRDILQRIHYYLGDAGRFIHCSSEYRMALRYDEPQFYNDRHLGVDLESELNRYFAVHGDLFPDEALKKNRIVRGMVTGENGGIAHPAIVYQKKLIQNVQLFNYGGDIS
jgi:ADP-heptose:LPS heptosyltransferase/SAM-dependent methyltransferase